MFESKKSIILFITRRKIRATSVTLGKQVREDLITALAWTPDTLPDVLSKLQKNIKDSVKILLSEDFVYEALVSLPKKSQITQDEVRHKAQELIPENLNKTVWSFKEIAGKIQVTAIVKSLFEQVSKSIARSGLRVDEIEPLSYALARFTKGFEKPFLFVYVEDETHLILAQKEAVLATERLESHSIKAINQFVAFAIDSLGVDIKDVVLCGQTQNINLLHYQNANFRVEIKDINPAVSLAGKDALKESQDSLNLQLLGIIHSEKQNSPKTQETTISKKLFSYLLAAAIGFTVAIGLIGIFIFYNNMVFKETNGSSTKSKLDAMPTSTTTVSPTARPSSLNKSDYTIIVLNGSGVAGEATKTKELLTSNGFNVIRLGNAENPNYEKTQVFFKETVPPELILPLDKLLKTVYGISISKKLEENSESDILIIVGKK